ncbi:MAG: hypothetical protein H6677_06175 [Candidatus Obscuribacterales bacterium]|nr:hypothetical protein [Candidatus Obscuribacterales bacterium]
MNGDSYTMFNDGSMVFKNNDNKVTETMNKYGDVTTFDYDKDGNIIGMGQDGEYWTTADGKPGMTASMNHPISASKFKTMVTFTESTMPQTPPQSTAWQTAHVQ